MKAALLKLPHSLMAAWPSEKSLPSNCYHFYDLGVRPSESCKFQELPEVLITS